MNVEFVFKNGRPEPTGRIEDEMPLDGGAIGAHDDVQQARSEEAHVWASRHNMLTARLQMVEDRYMALVKQVAEGAGLVVPQIMVAQLSSEFMQAQADEAPRLDLGA